MIRIELTPYDKKDLLQLLDILEENNYVFKNYSKQHFDLTEWWLMRIDQIRQSINGYVSDSIIKSSYETIDEYLIKEEKRKRKYKEKLESDVIDVFDCK